MLLRTTISTTKNFIQKTLKSLKSFLSQDYQRLPKSPPLNPTACRPNDIDMINLSQSYEELDKFYTDFTHQLDNDKHKAIKKRSKKKTILSSQVEIEKVVYTNWSCEENFEVERGEEKYQEKKRLVECEGKIKDEGRSCLVEKKLKELEMMDKRNIEHVLDIEEFLHYYSSLTCPAYIDVVEKFFMEIYAEIIDL